LEPYQCMDETQAKGENTLKWNKKCTKNVFEGENTLCKKCVCKIPWITWVVWEGVKFFFCHIWVILVLLIIYYIQRWTSKLLISMNKIFPLKDCWHDIHLNIWSFTSFQFFFLSINVTITYYHWAIKEHYMKIY
jgi:hypothetical protein